MSAAVAPTHTIQLTDGSVLTIGRTEARSRFSVIACRPGSKLGTVIEKTRGRLTLEQVVERMRLLGPNCGDTYIPTDNSPIEIVFVDNDDREITLYDEMTTETAKV